MSSGDSRAEARKALDRCANGCDAPPKPPSRVLCAKCFDALDAKMSRILAPARARRRG